MKRTVSFLTLFFMIFLFTNLAFAQMIGAGIKVGAGIANLQGGDNQDTDSKTGFVGGAFMTYAFNDYLAVQPEAMYVFKGAKFTATDPVYGEIDGDVIFDYVEIPVLIKGTLPTSGNIKPSVFIGPSLAIRTNAKIDVNTSTGLSDSRSVSEETSSTDFGLSFGAGVDFVLAQGKITFDGRYNLGMGSTFEQLAPYGSSSGIWFTGDDTMKNSLIAIMLGFSFM